MKTPREAFKENFWIGAKGGLVDAKHVEKMGSAIWLFLYLLRSQTGINVLGEGIVNYGHPITLEEIGAEFKGIPARTIRKWTSRLRREGYVRTQNHSNRGLIFRIAKAKPKTRKVKITADEGRSMLAAAEMERRNFRPNWDTRSKSSRPGQDVGSTNFRPNMDATSFEETPQLLAAVTVAVDSETPIPKAFTSENLSYHNKESRAQNARSRRPRFKKVLEEKSAPRGISQAELEARQRQLRLQGEEIIRKYAAHGQSGRVAQMQPPKAIA